MDENDINNPDALAEVQKAFAIYEAALRDNDVGVLNTLFWKSSHTLRYGVGENLYGYDEIAQFRAIRAQPGGIRRLENTRITVYGNDMAIANTEFRREQVRGRQSQVWVRMREGWRIVAAHVSLLPEEL